MFKIVIRSKINTVWTCPSWSSAVFYRFNMLVGCL